MLNLVRSSGLALLFASSVAQGHAVIMSSQPRSGATVAGAAVPLRLRFNSRIDRLHSQLVLIAPDGNAAVLLIEAADAPGVISAKARELRPGNYQLHWQVMSVDGHITRGDVRFEVAH